MPWVCSCGQRNIVNGLACLACDRLPDDSVEVIESPVRAGFRFRDESVDDVVEEEVEETPQTPGRRFRFTVVESELTAVQSRDTGSEDAPVGGVTSTEPAFVFTPKAEEPEVPAVEEPSAPVDEEPVIEEPVWESPVVDEPSAPVDEAPVADDQPSWPDVDRRTEDRRHDDRRAFDTGVAPGELDDRLGGFVAPPMPDPSVFEQPVFDQTSYDDTPVFEQPAFEQPVDVDDEDDPWATMRDAFDAVFPQPAPVQESQPQQPVDEDDPWEAFRLARQQYETDVAAHTGAPVQDAQSEQPTYDQPTYAQPVEEFAVPAFDVDPYEVEAIDDHDPILDEVMAHDPNALTDEDVVAFPTPWGNEPVGFVPEDNEQQVPYDHDWAQWSGQVQGEMPAVDETTFVDESQPVGDNTWNNEDDGVWSTDAIADAHADWSTLPAEWATENSPWDPALQEEDVQAWAGDDADDSWTAAGAEEWTAPAEEEVWPVVSQPVVDDAWDAPQPQVQPAEEPSEDWPVVAQPAEAGWGDEADPWNVQQPVADDEWNAQPMAEDDPWNAQSVVETDATDETAFGVVDDPYAPHAEDDADGGEQPWWAEQSGFGGQFIDQTETNFPYFDELDAEDTEDPYSYEEPAYGGGVSDLFNAEADLDEPDPFELPEDDWSLPDEQSRATRAREQDREPAKNRGDRGPKKSQRPGDKKKKSSPKNKPSKGASSGFRLPFGSGSTAVTVVVIAIAIVALSLLFKDAFQRVGAAPNPDGSTAAAASCADSPSTNDKKVDLAAAMVSSLDGATVVVDHQAGTGIIDFTRALAAEPDPSTALNNLDQSRFERGYDRTFLTAKGGSIHVAIYQFKGPLCAAEYLKLHPAGTNAQVFTVADVQNASGVVTQVTAKSFNGLVRGPIGDTVVIAQYTGAPSADAAMTTLQKVLSQQVVSLRTAGVQ